MTLQLVHSSNEVASNYSDEEVLLAAEDQFQTPGPLLKVLLARFEDLLQRVADLEEQVEACHPAEAGEQPDNCPACGVALVTI